MTLLAYILATLALSLATSLIVAALFAAGDYDDRVE